MIEWKLSYGYDDINIFDNPYLDCLGLGEGGESHFEMGSGFTL